MHLITVSNSQARLFGMYDDWWTLWRSALPIRPPLWGVICIAFLTSEISSFEGPSDAERTYYLYKLVAHLVTCLKSESVEGLSFMFERSGEIFSISCHAVPPGWPHMHNPSPQKGR